MEKKNIMAFKNFSEFEPNDLALFYAQLGKQTENIGNKIFSVNFDYAIINELSNLKSNRTFI